MLEAFFSFHNPYERALSQQYQSIAFYQNPIEHKVIEDILKEIALKNLALNLDNNSLLSSNVLQTHIREWISFFPAEDYHQKYILQKQPEFANYLIAQEGSFDAFVVSLAATKLGAYLFGLGDWNTFERDLPLMQLSDVLEQKLKRLYSRYVLR